VPPAFKYFTAKQEGLLKQLDNSGRQNLQDQADELRTQVKEAWRAKKDKELAASDELMVRRYATAVALARQYNIRNTFVTSAIQRLAYFTDVIGEANMRQYVTRTTDPNNKSRTLTYTDGMYVQSRPGLTATPPSNGEAPSAPVAP
jgi:hypothetical protein